MLSGAPLSGIWLRRTRLGITQFLCLIMVSSGLRLQKTLHQKAYFLWPSVSCEKMLHDFRNAFILSL